MPEQETTPPSQAHQPQQDNISVDDFMQDTLAKAKLSADTVIDEATGIPEVKEATIGAKPELSQAEANAQTKRMMQARDMIQSRLLAFLAKDPERWKEFKLDQWEFDWLCEVYADTFQRLGKIPAWLDILLAETMIMGPRFYNVYNYRKVEKENERLKSKIKKMEANESELRRDTKTLWKIDNDGFLKTIKTANTSSKATAA